MERLRSYSKLKISVEAWQVIAMSDPAFDLRLKNNNYKRYFGDNWKNENRDNWLDHHIFIFLKLVILINYIIIV